MKNQLILLLTTFALAFQFQEAEASHAAGAEFTYRSIGSDQYILTYTLYRDCFGIPAPDSIAVHSTNSCGLTLLISPIYLPKITIIPEVLSTTCPSVLTTCLGGVYTGIEKYEYEDTVTLTGSCADWIFYHDEASRNSSITTILNPSSSNLTVYCLINNLDASVNSSPTFLSPPILFLNLGHQNCNVPGAYDADGDLLNFQIITPLTGMNVSGQVTFLSGYSASQPVISSPPCTFNSVSGEFCCTPSQPDVSVFAVLVSEFRNGILIGQVERDIQIDVLSTSNYNPLLTGYNGVPYAITAQACPGINYHSYIASIDNSNTDTTTITLDYPVSPQALYVNSYGKRDTLTLDWTPTIADTSSSPYTFSATVRDNACPYMGQSSRVYSITVLPPNNPYCISLSSNINIDDRSVLVFPNPAESFLQINFDRNNSLTGIDIYDPEGRKIKSSTTHYNDNQQYYIGDLKSGVYTIKLKFDNREVFRKFVKQ